MLSWWEHKQLLYEHKYKMHDLLEVKKKQFKIVLLFFSFLLSGQASAENQILEVKSHTRCQGHVIIQPQD